MHSNESSHLTTSCQKRERAQHIRRILIPWRADDVGLNEHSLLHNARARSSLRLAAGTAQHLKLRAFSTTARWFTALPRKGIRPFTGGPTGKQNLNELPVLGWAQAVLNDRFWGWVQPVCSDLSAFGQFQSVLDVNAQVAHRAVDLGMAEKDLNGAEVASRLVYDVRWSECVPYS